MNRTSAHLEPPMPELRVPNRADVPGAQPPWRQSGGTGQFSLSKLPRDVILGVLDELRADGPLTPYESAAEKPMINPEHVDCRTGLLGVCLASRAFYELAIPHLYRNPLVKSKRELFQVFRTLAKQADRRPMVRSFAWVGVMWEADIEAELSLRPIEEEIELTTELWDSIKDEWPRDRVDLDIAKLLGIDGPDGLKDTRLLGSVLAMCPRIKRLFMLNGAIIDHWHHCPERDAVLPFLRKWEFQGHSWTLMRVQQPFRHPFLEHLETLTLEGHSDPAASHNTAEILALIIMNSPLLRRVQIKHPPSFRKVSGMLHVRWPTTERRLTSNVKEVSLLRAVQPQNDMADVVRLFRNLVSLHAEFTDGSYRPPDHSDLPPGVSEALLRVSDTLETLSLTTSTETYPEEGHWVEFDNYPSSLSTLNQMAKLKDLTTESIWLFGTEDPAVALQLPHRLPPSLVRLHLIDYWGSSEPAQFYPEFHESWTPLEFYTRVFEALCNEHSVCLPELREVTFTAKCFNPCSEAGLSNGGVQAHQDETHITEDSMQVVRLLFERVGIRFRPILQKAVTLD